MFRENWRRVAAVSGKLARDGSVSRKTGSRRQGFPEKLTHQTRVTYNSPQFHHFLPHNYFEIILATNRSLVTA
jgi:hypothetical protein